MGSEPPTSVSFKGQLSFQLPNPTKLISLFVELEYNCNYNLSFFSEIHVFSQVPLHLETTLQWNVSLCAANKDLCAPYTDEQWVERRAAGHYLPVRYLPLLPALFWCGRNRGESSRGGGKAVLTQNLENQAVGIGRWQVWENTSGKR